MKTLTTVSSPHLGSRLIDNCAKYPNRFPLELSEKAIEAVGLSQKNVQEFTSENINDFNKIAENAPNIEYFSLGAYKNRLQSSDLLRHSHESIVGAGELINA